MELGIGIVTYNRLETLKKCVGAVEAYTRSPYRLVIADDGSADGSPEWARDAGYPVVTGERRGCAWNKNRALHYLLTRTDCDPILLLEDDTFPDEDGWERRWAEAGLRWGHVNWNYPEIGDIKWEGADTPEDPMRAYSCGGQCTVTTRAALGEIGYLDSRFFGWGAEHVEWTERFRWNYGDGWGLPPGTVPCLCRGVAVDFSHTWYDPEEAGRNGVTHRALRCEPLYRLPWRSEAEREAIEREVAGAAETRLVPGV